MSIVMGPVMSFRGVADQNGKASWRVSILVVLDDAALPAFTLEGQTTTSHVVLWEHRGRRVLRFDATVPLGNTGRRVAYDFGQGVTWHFSVPAHHAAPRIAYVSCNGFSSADGMKRLPKPANAMWEDLLCNHDKAHRPRNYALDSEQRWHEPRSHDRGDLRFHLLMMGGDQIYLDSIWEEIPALKDWIGRSRDEQVRFKPSATLIKSIEDYYFTLYVRRWAVSRNGVWGSSPSAHHNAAAAMASIPTLMMWDDHDIFDGWGSYAPELQSCPLFQVLFDTARRCFWVFQMQHRLQDLPALTPRNAQVAGQAFDPDFVPIDWKPLEQADSLSLPLLPDQPGFSSTFVIGPLALVILDLRTERSQHQVLGAATWERLGVFLQDSTRLRDQHVEHLLIVSSVPVAHPKLSIAEAALTLVGTEHVTDGLTDDLQDHWSHRDHDGERKRLIRTLIRTARQQALRVSIVSGDVHVAAWGSIFRKDASPSQNWLRINQFTSTAIVHPSMTSFLERIFLRVLNTAARHEQEVDTEHGIEMMQFPGASDRIYAARNWLALEADDEPSREFGGRRLWGTWRCEGTDRPTNHLMAVHPYRPTAMTPAPSVATTSTIGVALT